MSDFDDDLRQRLTGAAGELERSSLATTAPHAVSRAVRRHRRSVAAQAAVATLAVVAAATLAPRLWAPTGSVEPVPFAASESATPTPEATVTEQPTPEPRTSAPDTGSPTPAPRPPMPSAIVVTKPASLPPERPQPTAATPTTAPAARCPSRTSQEAAKPAGVTVSLEMSDRTVAQGSTVRMTVVVRNGGTQPVEYTSSGQEYDFWVQQGTETRWIWSIDKAFTQELRNATLKPGEEVRRTVTWNATGCSSAQGEEGAPLAPGQYAAYGYWVSDAENGGGWTSPPLQFEIG